MKEKNIKRIEQTKNISIEECLADKEELMRIFRDSERHLNSQYIYWHYLFKRFSASNYIYNILKKGDIDFLNNKEKEMINNYVDTLYSYLFQNASLIYSDPIFSFDDETLTKMFGSYRYNRILALKQRYTSSIEDIYDRYMSSGKIIAATSREINMLLDFFTGNIETLNLEWKTKQNEFLKKILLDNHVENNLRFKNFVLQYLMEEKCAQLNLKAKLLLCDCIFNNKEFTSYSFENLVALDAAFLRNSKISNLSYESLVRYKKLPKEFKKIEGMPFYYAVQNLYFELYSCKYKDQLSRGILNSHNNDFLECTIFSEEEGFGLLNDIYSYEDVYLDIRIRSLKDTIQFFESYAPELIETKDGLKLKGIISSLDYNYIKYKLDCQDIRKFGSLELVVNFNSIIKNNPNLISENEVLGKFYDEDGKLKNFNYFVNQKILLDKSGEDSSIFNKYILYYISMDNLDTINLSNCDRNWLIRLLFILRYLVTDECTNLNQILNIEMANKDRLSLTLKEKINTINKIFDFIRKAKIEVKEFDIDSLIFVDELNDKISQINDCILKLSIKLSDNSLNDLQLESLESKKILI